MSCRFWFDYLLSKSLIKFTMERTLWNVNSRLILLRKTNKLNAHLFTISKLTFSVKRIDLELPVLFITSRFYFVVSFRCFRQADFQIRKLYVAKFNAKRCLAAQMCLTIKTKKLCWWSTCSQNFFFVKHSDKRYTARS